MKIPKPSPTTIAIAAATCMIVVVLGNVIKKAKKKKGMSEMLSKLIPFIRKVEGGLSRAKTDTAHKNPAPWTYKNQTGWHTNKGIQYVTFKSLAKGGGYEANANNFFTMPDDIWMKILEQGFIKPWGMEKINHLPRIQAVLITWGWGSGVPGATGMFKRYIKDEWGITVSSRSQITETFNQKINALNEKTYFQKLCDRRLAIYKSLNTWPANGRGWSNRLNEFRALFQ